jgi:hypothetical protein
MTPPRVHVAVMLARQMVPHESHEVTLGLGSASTLSQ